MRARMTAEKATKIEAGLPLFHIMLLLRITAHLRIDDGYLLCLLLLRNTKDYQIVEGGKRERGNVRNILIIRTQ